MNDHDYETLAMMVKKIDPEFYDNNKWNNFRMIMKALWILRFEKEKLDKI